MNRSLEKIQLLFCIKQKEALGISVKITGAKDYQAFRARQRRLLGNNQIKIRIEDFLKT